jgi:GxxExxY protein
LEAGMFEGKHSDVTEKVIGAFFKVYNALGYGFSEKVYENSQAFELRKSGLQVEQQKSFTVYYEDNNVANAALIFW